MFQFRRLALSRVLYLQYSGLSHSEIYGYIACVQLPVAYRSLPRPSSPLKAKASAMCPYVALKKLKLCSVTTTKKLLGLQLLFSQYVKELSLLKESVDVWIANPRPQVKTCITSGFLIKFRKQHFKRTNCGGERIRTDDPLRARQVL